MSSRAGTFALAILALGVLLGFLFQPGVLEDRYFARTDEDNAGGLAGLTRWLTDQGMEVTPLVERLDATSLPQSTVDVLLVHVPPRERYLASEIDYVHEWVEAGGTLVVASFANEDLPTSRHSGFTNHWEFGPGLHLEDAQEGAGILNLEQLSDEALGALELLEDPPAWVLNLGGLEARTLVPAGPVAMLRGVERLEVIGDLHEHRWTQARDDASPWIPLLVDEAHGGEVMWSRAYGQGRIHQIAHASVFSNQALARADNATFARNVLAGSLGSGGRLWVDDGHQGALEDMDADALTSDARFWLSILILAGFWLVWLLADDGAWDRATAPGIAPSRRRADLVRAMGGFLARHLTPGEAASRVVQPLRVRLAALHGGAPEDGLRHLGRETAISATEREALLEDLRRAGEGKRVRLDRLHNRVIELLERIP